MIDILHHNIIALIPVYRENEAELKQTISAFQQMRAGLNLHLVFIVDGYKDSLPSLHKLLWLSDTPHYQTGDCFDLVSAAVPGCAHTSMNFHLLVKHRHGGKRDSIALFLKIILDSVTENLSELIKRYPEAATTEDLLKKHELSLFIIDSDTHFAPDALQHLYQTLWHDNHSEVYCATPALQCRARSYTDFFSLAQNAEYQIMNHFILSYLVNGEVIASDTLLFGLQACGMLKAAYLMDESVIAAYGKKSATFKEAIFCDMNEDTYLSMLIRNKNPKLIYVPSAQASTTLPGRLSDFLIQRKRWRNGNMLQQKSLKQEKLSTLPFFKKFSIQSLAFIKKIFYSPAAYFYLLLSIVSSAWSSCRFTTAVENYLFAGFLLSSTAIMMLFSVRRYTQLYNAISVLAAAVGILTYAAIFSILIDILKGNGSLAGWLAFFAMGLTPVLTIVLMLKNNVDRMPLFLGLITKYLMLEPIFRLIFPIYSLAKLDDLSWNISNSPAGSTLAFKREGRKIKNKALSLFIIENLSFSLLLSFTPMVAILSCFVVSEVLQWFVLLFAPLLQELVQKKSIEQL